MPCFRPSKKYLVKLTSKLIDSFQITEPFLEVGCGDGAFTELFAQRNWSGKSIDLSGRAVTTTRSRLADSYELNKIRVEKQDFIEMEASEKYNLVIMYDVLEHIHDDTLALRKLRNVILPNGYLLISFPVKMKEWRWDDENYGHFRRYEQDEIRGMFNQNGFEIVVQWDITFPVIWALRRLYTRVNKPDLAESSVEMRTECSAFESSAGTGIAYKIIERLPIWWLLFGIQDLFIEKNYGCNTLLLVKRI